MNRPVRRKEVYARAATQLRTHARAFAAERACPGALGLYFFCLLQARGEETWGELSEEIVLSAWGVTRSIRKRQADALVAAGLLSKTERGYTISKYGEHNDTPDVIEANRTKERTKKKGQRNGYRGPDGTVEVSVYDAVSPGDTPGTAPGTPPPKSQVTPISTSISPSGSGSSGEGVGEGPPPWFVGAAETAAMQVGGEVDELPARWASYNASRTRKGWSKNHADAVGWLCDVVRGERERRSRGPIRAVRPQDMVQEAIAGSWSMPSEMP